MMNLEGFEAFVAELYSRDICIEYRNGHMFLQTIPARTTVGHKRTIRV